MKKSPHEFLVDLKYKPQPDRLAISTPPKPILNASK